MITLLQSNIGRQLTDNIAMIGAVSQRPSVMLAGEFHEVYVTIKILLILWIDRCPADTIPPTTATSSIIFFEGE